MTAKVLTALIVLISLARTPSVSTFANPLEPGFPPPSETVVGGALTASAQQAYHMALVGQLGGSTKAVAVQGNYAYLGVGPRVLVLDISNSTHPTFVGQSPVLPGVVHDLVVAGSHAYVASRWAGLRILNVADPTRPVEVGSFDTPGSAMGVAVVSNHAFVADGSSGSYGQSTSSGLHVINVADPTHPVEVGMCATVGAANGVAIAGSYAYVGDQGIWNGTQSVGAGLRIISIADLSHPKLVGGLEDLSASAVAVSGKYVFAASGYSGMKAIDVSDSSHPVVVGTYSLGGFEAYDLVVQGTLAYVVGGWRGLAIVDVSNPANPTALNRLQMDGSLQGVFVAGDKVYVAAEYGVGLRIVNVATPTQASEIGSYETKGWTGDSVVAGNTAYIATAGSALRITDIKYPASLKDLSYIRYGAYRLGQDHIAVAGDYAYIAYQAEGLQIIDVADPTNPTLAGFYDSPGDANGIAVAGGYAYLADGSTGLSIIAVTDPANPVQVGSFDTFGTAFGVTVVGNRAYVADGSAGLRIFDVSTPSLPTEIGFYDTAGSTKSVSIVGNCAYIADSGGLRIVDVSNPATPAEVSYRQITGNTEDVAMAGNYAFTASGSLGGMHVFDVSNPAAPAQVGFYISGGYGWGIEAAGNLVYVADGWMGLIILRYLDKALYLPLITRN